MALETLPVLGYQIEDLGKVFFYSITLQLLDTIISEYHG